MIQLPLYLATFFNYLTNLYIILSFIKTLLGLWKDKLVRLFRCASPWDEDRRAIKTAMAANPHRIAPTAGYIDRLEERLALNREIEKLYSRPEMALGYLNSTVWSVLLVLPA